MKIARPICISLAFPILVILFSCKKDHAGDDQGNNQGGNNNPPNNNATCTATPPQAESIAVFPSDNPWNEDISAAVLETNSAQTIAGFSGNSLKADFGSGEWDGAPIGIPYSVVCGDQAKSAVTFRSNGYDDNYGDESDAGPYAIPLTAAIEGDGQGDSHVIAVDIENRVLYELYNASVNGNHWEASSGAIYDLKTNTMRPEGWTSADAAGLPIFPGLVRYEEILKGSIDHPIRFTLNSSNVKAAYVYPARHKVGSNNSSTALPFGARIRLKAGVDISGFSSTNQVILRALKKYGLILADIGSNLYISGAPDSRWDNDDLHDLGQIKGTDFEVVQVNH